MELKNIRYLVKKISNSLQIVSKEMQPHRSPVRANKPNHLLYQFSNEVINRNSEKRRYNRRIILRQKINCCKTKFYRKKKPKTICQINKPLNNNFNPK